MKKNYKQLLKNFGLLVAFIIICALLARHFSSSETLLEYANKNGSTTDTNENINDKAEKMELTKEMLMDSEAVKAVTAGVHAMPVSKERVTYKAGFYFEPLNEEIKMQITGSTYPEVETDDMVIHYDDLRYVSVKYFDYSAASQTGELICNAAIAQDLVEIFYELYVSGYQIAKMNLMDAYGGDDDLACADNNTSCFNYRTIAGTNTISQHAYGLAVDINPVYNPYITYQNGTTKITPVGSESYADRTADFPYKIDENDLCYQLFIAHGFTWGGKWNHAKDYQHFQKVLD